MAFNPVATHTLSFVRYSDLTQSDQMSAMKSIKELNTRISTIPGRNWNSHSRSIEGLLERNPASAKTLFLAKEIDKLVGYAVFYTRTDNVDWAVSFLDSDKEAYCAWAAIDESYRGKTLSVDLMLQIFKPENGNFTAFKGHVKESNKPALAVLDKLTVLGFSTSRILNEEDREYACIVTKLLN